jgi:hypothetical protein
MTSTRIFGVVGITGALIAAACSSNSTSKAKPAGGTGAAQSAEGGSPDISLGTGGSGADGTGAAGALTADGLVPLNADQANQFTAAACKGWQDEPEKGPAVLEFQVDVTNSMSQSAPSTGGRSKWQVMQSALPQAFQNLPTSWAVGLAFFNLPQQGQCYQGRQAVPIALLSAQQQTALANAIQAQGTAGWTPTEPAYMFALQQIQAFTGSPDARRYIVLVTDGIPTVASDGCTTGPGPNASVTQQEYDHFIATVTAQTAATGVKTFVVGVPGSEDPQGASYDPMYELSLVAQAGGTTAGCTPVAGTIAGTNSVNPRGTYCHYDMTQTSDFAASLVQTIGDIAGRVVSCTYKVPDPPDPSQVIVPSKTNMVYDDGAGQKYLVQQNNDPNCQVGWHFTDSSNQTIEICSTTCALLQANPKAGISLTFGCNANQIPT